MARVKTFYPGATLTHTDLNNIQDDYEIGYSSYRKLYNLHFWASPQVLSSTSIFLLRTDYFGGALAPYTLGAGSGVGHSGAVFRINPTDHISNQRTTQYRFSGMLWTNNTAPGSSFTFNLYANLTTNPGGFLYSGTVYGGASLGITVLPPAANSRTYFTSPLYNITTAENLVLAFRHTPATNSNSSISINAIFDYKRT
jgi:hypothetical protein